MSHTLPIELTSEALRGLVRAMQPGDEIIITEDEKPIARIVSNPSSKPNASQDYRGAWKGKLEILDEGDDTVIEHFKDYLP